MAGRSFAWPVAPNVGVAMPAENADGWGRAVVWCALLEAWGVPFETIDRAAPTDGFTTILTPELLPKGLAGADTEAIADDAFATLEREARGGLVALWRWPDAKTAALVVDGDVDHPTGIDPECSRYVRPAIETARRANYTSYGIFAAAANVDAEPSSFPTDATYYNHSYSHPYSHWNVAPWESLSSDEMRLEITRSDDAFRRHLGTGDHRIFRLPHFQWDAWDRSADVLEDLGYLAESSVGANRSVTGGLPYRPAATTSEGSGVTALCATSPIAQRRRSFLQLPISTDPTDPAFPNGCCSYNTLGEGVRSRTAAPEDYENVLQDVLDRAVVRRSLAHLFIDPPDAGYGRLPGDTKDYAGAVQRWLTRAVDRADLAVMSTSQLATWWLAREAAARRMQVHVSRGRLDVRIDDAPPGATIGLYTPERGWRYERLESDAA